MTLQASQLQRLRARKQAPSSTYLVIAVKALLVLVILFMLPKLVDGRPGRTSRARKKRRQGEILLSDVRQTCENEVCLHMIPEESMNCVQLCISPACYQECYGDASLEDGEIDVGRAKLFEACAKEELRNVRKRQREEKILF